MKLISKSALIASGLLLAACSEADDAPLDGAWTLDGGQSRLNFITVKNGTVAEGHSFGLLSGSVGADGAASLTIDLASVATGVDTRDERMREFLFETGMFPSANVTATLDPAAFSALKEGETTLQPVTATLDLHGVQGTVEAEVAVTRAGDDKVLVETAKPIIIDAATYGLEGGVAKLQELAKLDGITAQVPVTFSLTFDRGTGASE